MTTALAAIVLAGGLGQRLGQPKPFVQLGGQPLIRWVLLRLEQAGFACPDEVLIVTGAEQQQAFGALNARVVTDVYPHCGPLGGLHAGLIAAGEGFHFVTSCDQPFLEPAMVRFLLERAHDWRAPSASDAIIPVVNNRPQVLQAVYHNRVAHVAAQLIERGILRLMDLLDHLSWLPISEDEIRQFGDPEQMFFNINTPQDLERAQQIAALSLPEGQRPNKSQTGCSPNLQP